MFMFRFKLRFSVRISACEVLIKRCQQACTEQHVWNQSRLRTWNMVKSARAKEPKRRGSRSRKRLTPITAKMQHCPRHAAESMSDVKMLGGARSRANEAASVSNDDAGRSSAEACCQ